MKIKLEHRTSKSTDKSIIYSFNLITCFYMRYMQTKSCSDV